MNFLPHFALIVPSPTLPLYYLALFLFLFFVSLTLSFSVLYLFYTFFCFPPLFLFFPWFLLSSPLCHLLFIKPVFSALLPSKQAPPLGSVYMVSYCGIPCTNTDAWCIYLCEELWYTHPPIHTDSHSLYCSLPKLSVDVFPHTCTLSSNLSALSDKPIAHQLSPLH